MQNHPGYEYVPITFEEANSLLILGSTVAVQLSNDDEGIGWREFSRVDDSALTLEDGLAAVGLELGRAPIVQNCAHVIPYTLVELHGATTMDDIRAEIRSAL